MKISKEELKSKVSEKIQDIDLATELLEDIEDSMDVEVDTPNEELIALKAEAEHLKEDLEEMKLKYKNRFLGVDTKDDTPEEEIEEDIEDKVIDIKEI